MYISPPAAHQITPTRDTPSPAPKAGDAHPHAAPLSLAPARSIGSATQDGQKQLLHVATCLLWDEQTAGTSPRIRTHTHTRSPTLAPPPGRRRSPRAHLQPELAALTSSRRLGQRPAGSRRPARLEKVELGSAAYEAHVVTARGSPAKPRCTPLVLAMPPPRPCSPVSQLSLPSLPPLPTLCTYT